MRVIDVRRPRGPAVVRRADDLARRSRVNVVVDRFGLVFPIEVPSAVLEVVEAAVVVSLVALLEYLVNELHSRAGNDDFPPTRPVSRAAVVASHEFEMFLVVRCHLCDLLVHEELTLSLSHALQERQTVSFVARRPPLANPGSFL